MIEYRIREGIYPKRGRDVGNVLVVSLTHRFDAFVFAHGKNRKDAWNKVLEYAKGEGWDLSFIEFNPVETVGTYNDIEYCIIVELDSIPTVENVKTMLKNRERAENMSESTVEDFTKS